MKCYVLTLWTDWGMILFPNIGEVTMSALCDCFILLIQRSQESKGRPGESSPQGLLCVQPGPGQAAVTLLGVCSASEQLLLFLTAVSWVLSDPLEESSLKRGLNCWGQPEERTQAMGEPVPLLLPTTVHLQAGWELLQPCLQEQDPIHAIRALLLGPKQWQPCFCPSPRQCSHRCFPNPTTACIPHLSPALQ